MKSPVRYLCGLAEQRNAQSAVFCILGVLLLLLSSHLILAVSPGEGSFARSRSAIAQENPLQDDIPVLKLYHSSTGGRQRRGLPWKNSDSSSVLKEDAGDWHAPLRRHSLDETVLDKSAGRKSLGQGIVKSVSTRAKRDHDQEHCNRTVSPAVIHCALSGKRTASLLFGSSNQPVSVQIIVFNSSVTWRSAHQRVREHSQQGYSCLVHFIELLWRCVWFESILSRFPVCTWINMGKIGGTIFAFGLLG